MLINANGCKPWEKPCEWISFYAQTSKSAPDGSASFENIRPGQWLFTKFDFFVFLFNTFTMLKCTDFCLNLIFYSLVNLICYSLVNLSSYSLANWSFCSRSIYLGVMKGCMITITPEEFLNVRDDSSMIPLNEYVDEDSLEVHKDVPLNVHNVPFRGKKCWLPPRFQ